MTEMSYKTEMIKKDLRKEYIGGAGINTKILIDSNAVNFDALSEENVLIFGIGPAVGSGLIAGNRCTITAKSPITERYGDSNIGGTFTVRMRNVGIDHLVLYGKANKLMYLYIDRNGNIFFENAEFLSNKSTIETTDILTEKYGNKCEVACIGPAGENLVRFASVFFSKNHVAGRTGMGCVMGSKNLKAIVVEFNTTRFHPIDVDQFNKIKTRWLKNCKKPMISKLASLYGTLILVTNNYVGGFLPINNYSENKSEKASRVFPAPFIVEHEEKKTACIYCPIGCSKKYKVREGRFKGREGDRIEYGSIASVGPNIGIFDWPSIIHLKLLSDEYGVDTIELGGVIGTVMECVKRGILQSELFEGKNIQFGSVDAAEYLINFLCKRQGFGNVMAEGVHRMVTQIGVTELDFSINKSFVGLPSNKRLTRYLGYMTSTRGGDHLKSFLFTMQNKGFFLAKHIFKMKDAEKKLSKTEKNGRILWWHENYKYILDSFGLCLFAVHGLPSTGNGYYKDFAKLLNSMFDVDMSSEDVLCAAERIYQLQNLFNIRTGLVINDYKWPRRKDDGYASKEYVESNMITVRDAPSMLPEYFMYRGLAIDGMPTVSRYKELGIEEYLQSDDRFKDDKDTVPISILLKQVNIDPKFNCFDKLKVNIMSKLADKILAKNYQKGIQQYERKRENYEN